MIPFRKFTEKRIVSPDTMKEIYEKIKTPIKVGAVMKLEDDMTDSPSVFKHGDTFYMYFITISKDVNVSGYETHLARSKDLFNWEYVGPIFRRNDLNRWDSKQVAGYAAYFDTAYEGSCELQKVAGAYHISYLAGNSDGYEPDPLYMGLSRSSDPTDPNGFVRFPDPILRPDDPDARPFETKTLYKSFIFRDDAMVTGYPYVNIFNAKDEDARERIFLAVSEDGEHFERYGDRAAFDIISGDPDALITGDQHIIKIGDVYVLIYFHLRRGRGAYNTFACSYDLVNWTNWDGKPLIEPEYEWEDRHAHKTWFLRYNGVNYHFYCAVNNRKERFIALAHS